LILKNYPSSSLCKWKLREEEIKNHRQCKISKHQQNSATTKKKPSSQKMISSGSEGQFTISLISEAKKKAITKTLRGTFEY
jgi:hypothetical protein